MAIKMNHSLPNYYQTFPHKNVLGSFLTCSFFLGGGGEGEAESSQGIRLKVVFDSDEAFHERDLTIRRGAITEVLLGCMIGFHGNKL